MSAGTVTVEFSEPVSGALQMNPEEPVRQRYLIHLTREQAGAGTGAVPQHRTPYLAADDGLLDQHLRVVLPSGLHRARQLLRRTHLADPERRTRPRRLHE